MICSEASNWSSRHLEVFTVVRLRAILVAVAVVALAAFPFSRDTGGGFSDGLTVQAAGIGRSQFDAVNPLLDDEDEDDDDEDDGGDDDDEDDDDDDEDDDDGDGDDDEDDDEDEEEEDDDEEEEDDGDDEEDDGR